MLKSGQVLHTVAASVCAPVLWCILMVPALLAGRLLDAVQGNRGGQLIAAPAAATFVTLALLSRVFPRNAAPVVVSALLAVVGACQAWSIYLLRSSPRFGGAVVVFLVTVVSGTVHLLSRRRRRRRD